MSCFTTRRSGTPTGRRRSKNINDNHVRYTHRNSVLLGLRPFTKMSYHGARPIFSGGGVTLTHYTDASLKERPYQEYFPGVEGLWPKHRYRLLWAWIFKPNFMRWIWTLGNGTYSIPGGAVVTPYNQGSPEFQWEWNQGPHMPGMLRINGSSALYTRWAVPVDGIHRTGVLLLRGKTPDGARSMVGGGEVPPLQKLLRNRNLGFQDGVVLEETRDDTPERYSAFDVETVAWRRLAILSAPAWGTSRHDPPKLSSASTVQRSSSSPGQERSRGSQPHRSAVYSSVTEDSSRHQSVQGR